MLKEKLNISLRSSLKINIKTLLIHINHQKTNKIMAVININHIHIFSIKTTYLIQEVTIMTRKRIKVLIDTMGAFLSILVKIITIILMEEVERVIEV